MIIMLILHDLRHQTVREGCKQRNRLSIVECNEIPHLKLMNWSIENLKKKTQHTQTFETFLRSLFDVITFFKNLTLKTLHEEK